MAPTQKLYPRATIKRIIKTHSKRNLSKNADILVSQAHCTPKLVANCAG